MSQQITPQLVAHIAQLANIPITQEEQQQFARAFTATLETIQSLQSIDVTGVEPTHQVTGLENVVRDDKVQPEYTFTQQQALANASKQIDGFFVVPQILNKNK